MERDSFGIIPSSNSSSRSLQATTSHRASIGDIARLIARATTVYGERRGVDIRLLTAEWHALLGPYSPVELDKALSRCMRSQKFFPAPSELLEAIEADRPKPGLPPFREGREPDLTPEEVSRRVEACAAIKRQFGFSTDPDRPKDANTDAKPASKDNTVSFALRQSCAARRARGEDTCGESCNRQPESSSCQLREERCAP